MVESQGNGAWCAFCTAFGVLWVSWEGANLNPWLMGSAGVWVVDHMCCVRVSKIWIVYGMLCGNLRRDRIVLGM